MLKKLPCPDNLKLIPYIRQQLSLDELSTFFRVLVNSPFTTTKLCRCFWRANLERRQSSADHVLKASRDVSVAK